MRPVSEEQEKEETTYNQLVIMADINVFMLFEEIKTTLNGLKSKVEEFSNAKNGQPQIGNDKQELSLIKEAMVETT